MVGTAYNSYDSLVLIHLAFLGQVFSYYIVATYLCFGLPVAVASDERREAA